MIPVLLIVIPLLSGALTFFMKKEAAAKNWAVISSLITLLVTLLGLTVFKSEGHLHLNAQWLPALGSSFSVGIDGMGKILTLLTAISFPVIFVATYRVTYSKPNNFFAAHLKRYHKSHRQAPIYWPLQTPSDSYTLWLYAHRLTDQTLYTCVNDFVGPKLKQLTEQLDALRTKNDRSKQEDKELILLR